MFLAKFIYEFSGLNEPTKEDLDDDIDRLLFVRGVEQPNHLVKLEERDQLYLDSEVVSKWIRDRFEPALIILLLESNNNKYVVKSELAKMYADKSFVERWFRFGFVENQALQRVRSFYFNNSSQKKLDEIVSRLKKTLTFLSTHLESAGENYTLLGTDAYTPADVTLYNYLKRILVGKFDDLGLKSHLKLCEPLRQFMHRFATKNVYVIDVSKDDPLDDGADENTLLKDLTKPALVASVFMLIYLWRKDHSFSLK